MMEIYLTLLMIVTGLIWFVDLMTSKDQAGSQRGKSKPVEKPWYVEYSRDLFPLLLVILMLQWVGRLLGIARDFDYYLAAATLITGVIWLLDRFLFSTELRQKTADWPYVQYPKLWFPVLLVFLALHWLGYYCGLDVDFAYYLSVATLLTGLVWLLDIAWLASRRTPEASQGGAPREPVYVEYSKSFFPVLLFVLLLRSFVAEPFRIPSGSMLPTLEVGDFILVNKYAYGLRMPVFNNKFVAVGEPQRGDIVVFRYPQDPTVDYIKRIVGLPGDHIRYQDKQLIINGEPVERDFVGQYPMIDVRRAGLATDIYRERLPGREHDILMYPENSSFDIGVTVPQGSYYVMGDNRDDSRDSRYWGFLPEENLVGKAFFVWMHYDFGGGGFKWSRVGESID